MLSVKLQLIGKKQDRSFRVIVQEAKTKLNGKSIEDLGWYNPKLNKSEVNKERAIYWLGVGAIPTDTVSQIFKKSNISVNKK